MRNKTQKSIISIVLVLALVVGCFATIAPTVNAEDGTQTVYLQGNGGKFGYAGWTGIFYLGFKEGYATYLAGGSTPNEWHLVFGDNKDDFDTVSYMQITFTNGETFKWTPETAGPSVNGGGKNPGWIIVTPAEWEIAYGEGSYLKTASSSNVRFTTSGFNRGIPVDPEGKICLRKTVNGIAFNIWADSYEGNVAELFSGVTFNLYDISATDPSITTRVVPDFRDIEPVAVSKVTTLTGIIDFTGKISQDKLRTRLDISGYYWIVEELSDDAAKYFVGGASQLVYIDDNGIAYDDTLFDYDAFYTIVNGYGKGYTLGYSGLNNAGDIFPIAVTNAMSTG